LKERTTQTTSESQILGLDCYTLGVNSSQVGVFEQRDEVSLSSFLESHNGGGLEAEISLNDNGEQRVSIGVIEKKSRRTTNLEILSDFTNETLEREFANEEFGRLLVTSDFT
jgi:hypothetical protein